MKKRRAEASFADLIPPAIAIWFLCGIFSALIISYTLSLICKSEAFFGYCISAVSFIAAFIASRLILSSVTKGLVINAAILSTVFIILALLIGFLIDSYAIDVSSILSLSTFTIAGCLSGCVFMPVKKNRHHLKIKKRS